MTADRLQEIRELIRQESWSLGMLEFKELLAHIDDLRIAIVDLLDHGSCYHSAIELDHNFDGEQWEERVLKLLA